MVKDHRQHFYERDQQPNDRNSKKPNGESNKELEKRLSEEAPSQLKFDVSAILVFFLWR
jgi:hypothetical protein